MTVFDSITLMINFGGFVVALFVAFISLLSLVMLVMLSKDQKK